MVVVSKNGNTVGLTSIEGILVQKAFIRCPASQRLAKTKALRQSNIAMNGKFVMVLAVLGYGAALFRCALEALRANSTPVFRTTLC